MRYRSTILYLVAVLILGGVYFLDVRSEKKEEAREEEARVLFPEIPETLNRLTIRRPARTLVLERGSEGEKDWEVTDPVRTKADEFAVNRVTSLLPHLKHTRIVRESVDDLGSFGLADPALVITWAGDDAEGSLSIGGESPIEKDFYARTGNQSRVVLLAAHNKEVLEKDLYDLRDKRLFTLAYDRVTRMEVARSSSSWSFLKSGETTWALEGEPGFPLDSERVNRIVRKLSWEEIASFEKEEAEDLSPYGLEAPDLRVMLSDGETREELHVGKAVEEGKGEGEARLYARMVQRPQVLTVKAEFLQEIPASLEELRRKELEPEKAAKPDSTGGPPD